MADADLDLYEDVDDFNIKDFSEADEAVLYDDAESKTEPEQQEEEAETEAQEEMTEEEEVEEKSVETNGTDKSANHEPAKVDKAPSSEKTGNHRSSSSSSNSSGHHRSGRRYQLYIGNLTWWTTDEDIYEACRQIGVKDILDIKFYENRVNGQSKGFCMIFIGTESSYRACMDRLCKKLIHGQNPVVTFTNKQSLHQFESQAKTRPPTQSQQREPRERRGPPNMGPMGPMGPGPGRMGPPGGALGPLNALGLNPFGSPGPLMNPFGPAGAPMGPMGHPGPMVSTPMGPPLEFGRGAAQPVISNPLQLTGASLQLGGPLQPHGAPPNQSPPKHHAPPGLPPPLSLTGPPRQAPPAMPPPPVPRSGGIMAPPSRAPDWQGRPQTTAPPAFAPPPSSQRPPSSSAPAPHVNPAFFPPPPVSGLAVTNNSIPPAHSMISEAEFEDIMNRNRTVSSSAISRAVADASAGEFASAIETLVTAVSLIKQSKVSHDERCKILISSLQDTLHGIEAKSYGRKDRDRSRSRDRDRDRDRYHSSSRRRDRSLSRDRSRSRDRYEDRRARDRERYYEDRYREKERRMDDRRGEEREVHRREERSRDRERDRRDAH